MIKGAKSIAEYAIRKWLLEQNFVLECFTLTMYGSKGILTDQTGDSMTLVYDSSEKHVYIKEN